MISKALFYFFEVPCLKRYTLTLFTNLEVLADGFHLNTLEELCDFIHLNRREGAIMLVSDELLVELDRGEIYSANFWVASTILPSLESKEAD